MGLRIAVASERRPKVEAVRRAVDRVAQVETSWAHAVIVSLGAESGVSPTPLSDSEMRSGARTRTREIQARLAARGESASLFLGLEGGLHVEWASREKRVWLRSWTYATDGDTEAYGCGPSVEVPAQIANAVLEGRDLAKVIDRTTGQSDVRSRGGTWGYLTRGLLGRADAFEAGVVAALARFYNRHAFAGGSE